MTEVPDSLTQRFLRGLDEKLDRTANQVSDLSADVRVTKSHVAGFMQNELAQDGVLAAIKHRLDRIERRPDLQEPRP